MNKTGLFFLLRAIPLFLFNCSFGQSVSAVDSVLRFTEDSTLYDVQSLSINTAASEFSPFVSDRNLLFCSSRNSQVGVVFSNIASPDLLDIYTASKIDSLRFEAPNRFSSPINTVYNDGPATLNASGTFLIFTSNAENKFALASSVKNEKKLQLYSSSLVDGKWSAPALLNFCIASYSYCHPSLSADGTILYFASDKPGGSGGMDVYSSIFSNGEWGVPSNLGTRVNTSFNEAFPFFSSDSTLYFSSDRPHGFGGFDIYESRSQSSNAILLESPLNSIADDFGVFIPNKNGNGYFSSNRNITTGDDIYFFRNKYPYFKDPKRFVEQSNCFTFYEASTLQGDDTLGLIYEWELGDGTKIKGLEAGHCYEKPGTYTVNLNIVQKNSGVLFYTETSFDFVVSDSEQVYINCQDTIAKMTDALITADKSVIPGYTITDYYWSFGDGFYSTGKSGKRPYRNEGDYLISLGVVAKNDSTGELHNFCVTKPVHVAPANWIKTTRGEFPFPSNIQSNYPGGEKDSLTFRVHLGSSETSIPTNSDVFSGLSNVREIKDDSLFRYTSGTSKTLSGITPDYYQAIEKGFTESTVVGFHNDSLIQNQNNSLNGTITNPATEPDKFSEKKNVYFSFNSAIIEKEYFPVLDSIVKVTLSDPDCFLTLYAFADTVGNKNYNLKLSLKRATAIKQYFVQKGIRSLSNQEILPMGESNSAYEVSRENNVGSERRVSIYLSNKKFL